MDSSMIKLVTDLVPDTYLLQGDNATKTRTKMINILLQHRKVPESGWDDATIEMLLQRLSLMDSNNFTTNSGMGEREGRIASGLVARRHYNFGHGIGRSGDITEVQPKAAGSSLMYKLTNLMVRDLFYTLGFKEPVDCFVVPVATGMALTLSMLALRQSRPKAEYVLWSRVDQKSAFKSILLAGFKPVVISTVLKQDELQTNTALMEEKMSELGTDNILCVITTTSCFAPRACDDLEAVSRLCKTNEVPHIINNAYGLYSQLITKKITRAMRVGKVDVVVQSTDKNLLVPVGGAIIACTDKMLSARISKSYPGRASATPILDVFMTLLSLGKQGYMKLVQEQEELFKNLRTELESFSSKYNEQVLDSPDNPISLAVTLRHCALEDLTKLGSMLFLRNVSGTRVISLQESKKIGDYIFESWGCHTEEMKIPYFTAAAGLGITAQDINLFIERLEKVFRKA